MSNARPLPRPYLTHRKNQRERILDAAEVLFIRDGIDKVNLSDIARAAQMTRNTLYEYFPNKQELAWAILQHIFAQGRAENAEPHPGNGLQCLEHFMLSMAGQVQSHPDHLRYIVEFNTLYAREANAERMRQATGRSGAANEDRVAGWIRQGIADGSIRSDVDPRLLSAVIWNLLSGMNARFALLGEIIQQEYELPTSAIYQEMCRTFLRGIQSNPSIQEQVE
jgi:AcrR family transcriptional regulator